MRLMQEPNQILLNQALNGERKAQLELYQLCYPVLISVARRYYRNTDEQMTVVNNAFVKVIQFLATYETGRFLSWVKRIISNEIIDRTLTQKKGKDQEIWKGKLLHGQYNSMEHARVGALRGQWKKQYSIDLDSLVHPTLFRLLGSYLDQGISIWNFPIDDLSFLDAIRKLETNSWVSIFKRTTSRALLLNENTRIQDILVLLVGNNDAFYEQYLYDQQFAHQGWSGMVSTVEDLPQTLLDKRQIKLEELILLELLLE